MAKKAQQTGKALVIVESPAKAKTINKYLGAGYEVMASMGHVRDLPERDLGIDINDGFQPTYEILATRKKVINSMRKVAASASDVYLATDLDREGEAIAWHLAYALDLPINQTKRVVFNEITKAAIQAAFSHPNQVNMDKVNAQQARRLLDRIVGYQLSPLLQEKMGRGLSAGRVQSVAVRLIVDREREIRAFAPEESWRIFGCFATVLEKVAALSAVWEKFQGAGKDEEGPTVKARNKWLSQNQCLYAELIKIDGREFNPRSVEDARLAAETLGFMVDEVISEDWKAYPGKNLQLVNLQGKLNRNAAPRFTIRDVQTRRSLSRPNAPFTTAALQQAASSELGFSPSRTMRVAQQLYEGVELGAGEGPVGLITYMRTDSTNLSADSIELARKLINTDFGAAYLPEKPNVFGSAKRAQEAHEAIRPSDATRKPADLKSYLSAEQARLYDLIWRRFVACQMTPAQWDATTIQIEAPTKSGQALFRSSGRRLVFDGFLRVAGLPDSEEVVLPNLKAGQEVAPLHLSPKQHYTSPPPRYSEAALVKKLEAEGIGRPSTYAAIIQTIQDRSYVDLVEKRLQPTHRGEMVTDRLVDHFPQIMDYKFTSYMEEELDKIEDAHLDWVHVLNEFYEPFRISLEKARTGMERAKPEPSTFSCPTCSKMMVYRTGKNGRFLSCSDYPDCKVSMNIDAEGNPVKEVVGASPCPTCGKPMILRKSRLGPFLGCSGYPDCNQTMPSDDSGVALRKVAAEDIKEACPDCNSPMSVKFARGRAFLGCNAYPKCKATMPMPAGIYVEKPKAEDAGVRCDKCGRAMLIRKGRRGPFLSCSGFPKCRNAMPMEKKAHLEALEVSGQIPQAPPELPASAKGRPKGGKAAAVKVDVSSLGPPPKGFAWTRTGRPVVETWPEEDLNCPQCKGEMTLKNGRYGPYYSCTRYPKCSFVANLRGEAKKRAEVESPTPAKPKPVPTDIPCDECGSTMLIRQGRSGPFLGCSKYPKCKNAKPLPEGVTTESLTVAQK